MISDSKEYHPISPRFAGAVFFAIFALLFLLFTKYTLLSLRDSALLPLLPSIPISIITGAFAGGLFGPALAKKSRWSRPFIIGVLIACLSLILGSLGVLTHYYLSDATFLNRFHQWQDHIVFYGLILLSLTMTIGIWLIPLSGLVAIYFNKHFLPGLLKTDQQRLKSLNQTKSASPHDD